MRVLSSDFIRQTFGDGAALSVAGSSPGASNVIRRVSVSSCLGLHSLLYRFRCRRCLCMVGIPSPTEPVPFAGSASSGRTARVACVWYGYHLRRSLFRLRVVPASVALLVLARHSVRTPFLIAINHRIPAGSFDPCAMRTQLFMRDGRPLIGCCIQTSPRGGLDTSSLCVSLIRCLCLATYLALGFASLGPCQLSRRCTERLRSSVVRYIGRDRWLAPVCLGSGCCVCGLGAGLWDVLGAVVRR